MTENLVRSRQLDVSIRGTRDYVQASQVLSRSYEILGEQDKIEKPVLINAKFEKITRNKVLLYFKPQPELSKHQIGSSVFELSGERISLFYYEESNVAAPSSDDKQTPIVRFENLSDPKDRPAGIAVFRSSGNAESLLEGIIAVIKRLHQEIDSSVVDVWFTAINRAALVDRVPTVEFEVNIRIDHLIKRMAGERVQTLSSVHLSAPQIGTIPTFQVAFSYRSNNAH